MNWSINLHSVLLVIQHLISFLGILVILSGVVISLFQYAFLNLGKQNSKQLVTINTIRLRLGRVLVLGLEFIVAADLIGTTTTPDYYAVGILASIVLIRTFLSYTLNKEIVDLSKEQN